jgi:hypothetical protein
MDLVQLQVFESNKLNGQKLHIYVLNLSRQVNLLIRKEWNARVFDRRSAVMIVVLDRIRAGSRSADCRRGSKVWLPMLRVVHTRK